MVLAMPWLKKRWRDLDRREREHGSRGGLRNVVNNGRDAASAPARAGFKARFERQVDPDGVLDPAERARLAHEAMKAYMTELARNRWRPNGDKP